MSRRITIFADKVADHGEDDEAERDALLHLTQLIGLLPATEEAVHHAAVLAGRDERVRVTERLFQLTQRLPYHRVLHSLRVLQPLQEVADDPHAAGKFPALLLVPANRPHRLHDHRDEPAGVHSGQLSDSGQLRHPMASLPTPTTSRFTAAAQT